eukprot:5932456-Prymnesium_polylepis.1
MSLDEWLDETDIVWSRTMDTPISGARAICSTLERAIAQPDDLDESFTSSFCDVEHMLPELAGTSTPVNITRLEPSLCCCSSGHGVQN